MKRVYFFLMMIAVVAVELCAVEVNTDALNFGEVTLGYNKTLTVKVSAANLSQNLVLTVNGNRHAFQYSVTPSTVTPAEAAVGKIVQVKFSPVFCGQCDADLVITSDNTETVVVPMTAFAKDLNPTITGAITLSYVTPVGSLARSVEVLRWADAELPPDPNTPVLQAAATDDLAGLSNYNFTIEGDKCFGVIVTRASDKIKTCTVRITYCPSNNGPHHATLIAECQGASPIYITLNGDPKPAIKHVTGLIDILIGSDDQPNAADYNGDGSVTINDVTFLIDRLLNDGQ